MNFNNVMIRATGVAEPLIQLSSEDFESKLAPIYNRLKLPYGRLELQTGIKSRGYWEPGTLPSTIASEAAKNCLANVRISPEEIDLLIFSSVCRDQLEPSSASVVHHNLGLSERCQSFDLSNACLGFMSAMNQAAIMIESGLVSNALIVSGENSGPLILKTIEKLNDDFTITRKDIKKYFANLTIGSAGVAMVLSRGSSGLMLERSLSLSDTSSASLCKGGGDISGLMMETDSELLLHAGVKLAKKAWEEFYQKNFTHIITHQVGVAHRNLLYDSLCMQLEKDFSTFETYGNTGSAAVVLSLHKFLQGHQVAPNENIAMLGIGSGLHTIMTELIWKQ